MTGGAGVQEKRDQSGLVKASKQNYGEVLFVCVSSAFACLYKKGN